MATFIETQIREHQIMPIYDSECPKCEISGPVRLSFAVYDEVQAGTKELSCPECDGPCVILFDPSTVQFVMKDGATGSFPSRAMKENAWRAKHRLRMAQRERDHVFKSSLQPNFGGVETGTWKEAQELARTEMTKELGTEAGVHFAKAFEPKVRAKKPSV
jgi:hypothetical protein